MPALLSDQPFGHKQLLEKSSKPVSSTKMHLSKLERKERVRSGRPGPLRLQRTGLVSVSESTPHAAGVTDVGARAAQGGRPRVSSTSGSSDHRL